MDAFVIYNAQIYTFDPAMLRAEALVVQDGRVLALGRNKQILSSFEEIARDNYDAGGRVILPGLTDAHIHLENYALGLQKVDCETATRQECLDRVAERARSIPAGVWLLGHGWNQNVWPEGFGSAADLDRVAPHNPVYLTAKSLHAGWANSEALRRAGLSINSSVPQGGRLARSEDGSLKGILFESAMALMEVAIPEPTDEELARAIKAAQENLWQLGLTGVHDFDRRRCFMALQQLNETNSLRLRVVKSIPLEDLPHAVALGLCFGFGNDFLRIGSVKAFADGALGPQTAAMLQPYEGDPENRGMLMLDSEELFEHGRLAAKNGLPMAVHAIGDRANHEVLNAFEQLRRYETENDLPALRHRIEHVQLLHAGDIERLAQLNIVASMQPIHATSDMEMADRHWGKRSEYAYAWRSQVDQGAHLVFGSDAPVESPNPFWGLHAAVTRQRRDGTPGPEGWYPEQRLTITQALQGFTTGPAFAAGCEDRLGKLAPGYLADLILLDTDPFTCPPEALADIRPSATMVAGEWVFQG